MSTRSTHRFPIWLQLALCMSLTVAPSLADDGAAWFGDMMHLKNIPAFVPYTFVFFLITMVVRLIATATDDEPSGRSSDLAG